MQTKNTFNTKKLGLFGLVTVATLGATALANAETYTVQKGDTLSAIAKKNGTTVDEIVSKNGIQDANKIYIGQKLTINEITNCSIPMKLLREFHRFALFFYNGFA